jgi:FMN phosphatase YigB (HAD superfamily)
VTLPAADVVFLVDVDNTLLDNGAIIADFRRELVRVLGAEGDRRYWEIFEELFRAPGFADYFGALQRYSLEHPRDPRIFEVSRFLLRYPFAGRVYPRALDVIAALGRRGPVVIVSDGDVVYQPYKIERSGLWEAARSVAGGVLVYVHKELMLDDIERRYPARRYVMVEDKIFVLAAMKAVWKERLTTVFVRQGHYAHDAKLLAASPAADITVGAIGDLVQLADSL